MLSLLVYNDAFFRGQAARITGRNTLAMGYQYGYITLFFWFVSGVAGVEDERR
jgi:hypothetical protein